jgi:hypothetical protein
LNARACAAFTRAIGIDPKYGFACLVIRPRMFSSVEGAAVFVATHSAAYAANSFRPAFGSTCVPETTVEICSSSQRCAAEIDAAPSQFLLDRGDACYANRELVVQPPSGMAEALDLRVHVSQLFLKLEQFLVHDRDRRPGEILPVALFGSPAMFP